MKNDFWTSFRVELDATADVKTAYKNANSSIDKLIATDSKYSIISARARGPGFDFPIFSSTQRQLDNGNIPEYQKIDYTRKELASPGFDFSNL